MSTRSEYLARDLLLRLVKARSQIEQLCLELIVNMLDNL